MALEAVRTLYRFSIIQVLREERGLVFLKALDTLTGSPVQILQWTPPAGEIEAHRERWAAAEMDDPAVEMFSDQTSCYVALPAGADPWPIVAGLEEKRLLFHSQNPVGETTDPTESEESEPDDADASDGDGSFGESEDVGEPPQASKNFRSAALVLAVLLVVLAAVVYSFQQQELRIRAQQQQAETDAASAKAAADAAQAQREEAERKTKEAEDEKNRLQQELARLREAQASEDEARKAAAVPPPPPPPTLAPFSALVSPIAFPSGTIGGAWFTSMVRTNSIRRQKVLVFSTLSEAHAYFTNDTDWKPGQMGITSVATGSGNRIVIVLSDTDHDVQAYTHGGTFPLDWIREKWNENYRITHVGNASGSWWVTMTKESGIGTQMIFGPSPDWPSGDIEKQYARRDVSMFITDVAYVEGKGIVVIMSALPKIRKQWYFPTWNQTQIEGKVKEGYRNVRAVKAGNTWYAVLSDTGEDSTWDYNEKEVPREWIQKLALQGYRIGWIW